VIPAEKPRRKRGRPKLPEGERKPRHVYVPRDTPLARKRAEMREWRKTHPEEPKKFRRHYHKGTALTDHQMETKNHKHVAVHAWHGIVGSKEDDPRVIGGDYRVPRSETTTREEWLKDLEDWAAELLPNSDTDVEGRKK